MLQIAKVVSVQGRMATLRFTRSKMCEHCGGCMRIGSDESEVQVVNTLKAGVDDFVEIELHARSFLQATLWAYVFPLAFLLAGVMLGSLVNDAIGAVAGILGAALAYMVLRRLEPRFARKTKYRPCMVSYVTGETELKREERGNENG